MAPMTTIPTASPTVPATQALVTLHQATVRFADVVALRQVTFSVSRGEQIALVGTNGSGKTTLLRALHGLLDGPGLDPSTRVCHAPTRQAMVFQRPFMLNLSVRRNLQCALWLARVPQPERAARLHDALARVGLADLGARAAHTLSGGQQQRLAMARALITQPDLMFLDEPTASLDPNAKREVEGLMASLAAGGMTLVFSTHNLGQAKRLATRVAYLEAGEVVCDAPTQEFFHRPQPPRAQAFLRGELGG